MKKIFMPIFLMILTTVAFAQTKTNSGKNFITYSYDNWETAAADYIKLCEDYDLKVLYLFDDTDFNHQNFFTVKPGAWNFFIVRRVDKDGIKGSFCICSPEGRQTELQGSTEGGLCSIAGEKVSVLSWGTCNPQKYLNDLKLRYSFLGEEISLGQDVQQFSNSIEQEIRQLSKSIDDFDWESLGYSLTKSLKCF